MGRYIRERSERYELCGGHLRHAGGESGFWGAGGFHYEEGCGAEGEDEEGGGAEGVEGVDGRVSRDFLGKCE